MFDFGDDDDDNNEMFVKHRPLTNVKIESITVSACCTEFKFELTYVETPQVEKLQ